MNRLIFLILAILLPFVSLKGSRHNCINARYNNLYNSNHYASLPLCNGNRIHYNKETHEIIYYNRLYYQKKDHQYKNNEDPIIEFYLISELSSETKFHLRQLQSVLGLEEGEKWLHLGVTRKQALVVITETSIYWIVAGKPSFHLIFERGLDI